MRISAPDAIQLPQADLDEAFKRWCHEQGVHNPRGENFSVFSELLRQQIQRLCPDTLMQTAALTFGGADGGGGAMLTGVQGEDVGRIKEQVGNITRVSPFSWAEYFHVLHRRITDHCPQAVVCEEPTDKGVALFVEDMVWDNIVNRVQQRDFLRRNVADVRRFDEGRWRMAQERLHANLSLWSVLHGGPIEETKPSNELASLRPAV